MRISIFCPLRTAAAGGLAACMALGFGSTVRAEPANVQDLIDAFAALATEICAELLNDPVSIEWIDKEGYLHLAQRLGPLKKSLDADLSAAENAVTQTEKEEKQTSERELANLKLPSYEALVALRDAKRTESREIADKLQELKENRNRVDEANRKIAEVSQHFRNVNAKLGEVMKFYGKVEDASLWTYISGGSLGAHDREYVIQRIGDINRMMDEAARAYPELGDVLDEVAFADGAATPAPGKIQKPEKFNAANYKTLKQAIGIQAKALERLQANIRAPLADLIDAAAKEKRLVADQAALGEEADRLTAVVERIETAKTRKEEAAFDLELANLAVGLLGTVEQRVKGCLDARRQRLVAQAKQRFEGYWRATCRHQEHADADDPEICLEGTFWITFGANGRATNAEWLTKCMSAPGLGRRCGLEAQIQRNLVFDAEHANDRLDARFTYSFVTEQHEKNSGFFKAEGSLTRANTGPGYDGSGSVTGRSTTIHEAARSQDVSICSGSWQTASALRCGQP